MRQGRSQDFGKGGAAPLKKGAIKTKTCNFTEKYPEFRRNYLKPLVYMRLPARRAQALQYQGNLADISLFTFNLMEYQATDYIKCAEIWAKLVMIVSEGFMRE